MLIVDDEVLVRRLVCDTLSHSGYEIAAAGNGCEALARLPVRDLGHIPAERDSARPL